MTEDIEKLPKWAQFRISKLERDLEITRKAMDAFAGTTKTNICVDPDAAHLRNGNYPRYLSDSAIVQFTLNNGKSVEVTIKKGALRILGDGSLQIHPVCINVISITCEDRP